MRQALELLETNGWAVRVPRRGYFASTPPSDHGRLIEAAGGFLEDEVGHGAEQVRTSVVGAARALLPDHAARALQLGERAEGFVLQRRRMLDQQLVLLQHELLHPAAGRVVAASEDVLRGVGSPTRALRLGGFVAAGSHRIIRALAAPRAVADQLGVDESVALLRIRSVTWDADRVPFDCYETWLRSDRVPLELSTSVHRPALTSIA